MKRIACAFFAAVAAVSAWATDYTWSGNPASYTSPRAGAYWCDTAIWGGSGYPNGTEDKATFAASASESSAFFFTNNVAINLYQATLSGNKTQSYLCYVCEKPIAFYSSSAQIKFPWIYAPVVIGGNNPYFNSTRFCGDFDIPSGRNCLFHTGGEACFFHYDRYATAAGEAREIPAWKGTVKSYAITMNFYAPESSTSAVTCNFSQEAGSTYLYRTGSQTVLPVGTIVTGTGIPDGTYLKRVFPGRAWIELSNPVTATITGNKLTFAAFSPKVHHRIALFSPNGSVCQTRFQTGKYAESDEYVIELDSLTLYTCGVYGTTVSDRAVIFGLAPSDAGNAPAYPGRVVIHKATEDRNTNVQLETCDLLFSTTTSDLGPGFPRATVRVPTATAEAQLSVTGAMTAAICEIQNFKGTIVKAGSGSLRVGFTTNQVANTGSLVVEEGTFAIANPSEGECKSADDIPTVGALEIAAGATLRLPTRGLRVTGDMTVAAGGAIEGTGTLHCAKAPYVKGTVSPTVTIALDATGATIADIPAPVTEETLPGDPAFWVDCSKTETMTFVTLDHTEAGCREGTQYSSNGVYRINDVRKKSDGDKYLFSTNSAGNSPSVHMPLLQYDKSKDLHHVYFHGNCLGGNLANTTKAITNTDAHVWSKPIADIRVIFEVYGGDGTDSGGGTTGSAPILGSSSWARNNAATPKGKTFQGGDVWGRYNHGTHCFISWATALMLSGTFYVNGKLTVPGSADNPLREYPPYGSPLRSDLKYNQRHCYRCHPMVVDMEIPEKYGNTLYSLVADAYTFTPGYANDNCPAIEQKRLFELIVYTNALTEAQVVGVRRYLMRKWLGQDAAVTVRDMNPDRMGDLDSTVDVTGADDVILAESIASDASFTKTGAGAISVEDAYAPQADVSVSNGTLRLRSPDFTRPPTNAEDGVRLLLDASKADSDHFELEDDAERGVTTVKKWKDQKPANKIDFSLWKTATTNRPFLVENALNGLSVVDFGPFAAGLAGDDVSKSSPALYTPTRQLDCHAVMAVWGSANGGGSLLGQVSDHYNKLGLCRAPNYGGSKDDPLFYSINGGSAPFLNSYAYVCRRNGVAVKPQADGLSGTFDLVTYSNWSPIDFEALQVNDNDVNRWMGGGQFGEILVFDIAPAAPHLNELEAYFRKKWFDIDTDGYREASLKSLAIAPGAAVEVTGGGILHVQRLVLSGGTTGGTLTGQVDLAAGAELTVTVNENGSVTPLAITGAVDLSKGGTVKFAGKTSNITKDEHLLVQGVGETSAELWTVDTSNLRKKFRRNAKVYVRDGNLYIRLNITGLIFTIQ